MGEPRVQPDPQASAQGSATLNSLFRGEVETLKPSTSRYPDTPHGPRLGDDPTATDREPQRLLRAVRQELESLAGRARSSSRATHFRARLGYATPADAPAKASQDAASRARATARRSRRASGLPSRSSEPQAAAGSPRRPPAGRRRARCWARSSRSRGLTPRRSRLAIVRPCSRRWPGSWPDAASVPTWPRRELRRSSAPAQLKPG